MCIELHSISPVFFHLACDTFTNSLHRRELNEVQAQTPEPEGFSSDNQESAQVASIEKARADLLELLDKALCLVEAKHIPESLKVPTPWWK